MVQLLCVITQLLCVPKHTMHLSLPAENDYSLGERKPNASHAVSDS